MGFDRIPDHEERRLTHRHGNPSPRHRHASHPTLRDRETPSNQAADSSSSDCCTAPSPGHRAPTPSTCTIHRRAPSHRSHAPEIYPRAIRHNPRADKHKPQLHNLTGLKPAIRSPSPDELERSPRPTPALQSACMCASHMVTPRDSSRPSTVCPPPQRCENPPVHTTDITTMATNKVRLVPRPEDRASASPAPPPQPTSHNHPHPPPQRPHPPPPQQPHPAPPRNMRLLTTLTAVTPDQFGQSTPS